jgi:uncharacterized protein (TIGR03067 family)
MNTSIECPEIALLRQFLDGSALTDVSETWTRDRVEQHVNECEVCQRSIERLVAGQESWEGAARQLAEIDAARSESSSETPALRDLIDHEKGRLPGAETAGTGSLNAPSLASISLDFLLPTDQPDSRGRLGTYEILDVVGRGGMGLVLKAYDPSLRRIVAIKVMAGHLASSPVARKRFTREARAAAAVSHDHVVAIYSVEEYQEPPFIVMQFVGGKTLQERVVASGPLAVPEILRIGMQTASGLAAAHAQGLVHRDIKPANILLENGVERVKITDFGLARAVDDVGMTQTGLVAGTPQYMAPEQANGESIDVRSDLFSLGSVLYTLSTGRPPFRATTTMGLLKRICEETPRPIRELNPDIPEWLDDIIGKLLEKRPADRYQSAKDVAELLGNWLAHVQHPTSVPAPNLIPANPETSKTNSVRVNQAGIEPSVVASRNTTEVISTGKSTSGNSLGSDRPTIGPIAGTPVLREWLSGDYSRSQPFEGDARKAFDLAVAALTASGFTLNERTASRLKMKGPGLNRLKGNTLAAASEVEVTHHANLLSINARMGTLRKLHGLLLFLFALGSILFFFQFSQKIPVGLLGSVAIGLFLAISVMTSRRAIRKAFDIFLGNLAHCGISTEIQDPSRAIPPKTRTFAQQLKESIPSRVYWIVLPIWCLFMLPLSDTMNTIPFPGLFWVALAIIVLGFAVPLIVTLYAWGQKRHSGSWETTILKGSPQRLLLHPASFPFLYASTFWMWQQFTCGVVKFDIDDRSFTVGLSRIVEQNRYVSIGNYSADFYALRLKAGKYYWNVKHGLSAIIDGGEFELKPGDRHVIRTRSPYPVGESDIAFLPGRWKFSYQLIGSGPTMMAEKSSPEWEYVDFTNDALHIASPRTKGALEAMFHMSGASKAAIAGPHLDYAIRFPSPPTDQRGPKWIDLLLPIGGTTNAFTKVAHGVFLADTKMLSMRLSPATFPRPTEWSTEPNGNFLMLQFERADDVTLLQGGWTVLGVHAHAVPELSQAIQKNAEPIRFYVSGNELTMECPPGLNGNPELKTRVKLSPRTLKIDPLQTPKRITLTEPPDQGKIEVQEGIYRFDGDKLDLVLGQKGRIPSDFETPHDDTVIKIELRRVKP